MPPMTKLARGRFGLVMLYFALLPVTLPAQSRSFAPESDEEQLPYAMRSKMEELPTITVGRSDAVISGTDQRALQAAIDYVAGLGGGTVVIGPGEYVLHDSIHLRSYITLRGTKGQTILRKASCVVSPLALDGDYGEEQITVADAKGFDVGCGVAIWDSESGGFHTTVARITGKKGNTLAIDHPLLSDCMVSNKAQAATVFPVVSGCNIQGARIEDLIVDGNRKENVALNGCRGGGIYLCRAYGTIIERCTVKSFHGDGISFQQSNDVVVAACVSEDNADLGIHPGSGSQRAVVRECAARRNGGDGLFLCWRVRHGLFEKNILEDNGRFGISIGHKDSDNLLLRNTVRGNHQDGIHFRNEIEGMAAHRNRLLDNLIEDNGVGADAAGVRIRGETSRLVFRGNVIRDTRPAEARRQAVGIRIEDLAGEVVLEANQIEAKTPVEDLRKPLPATAGGEAAPKPSR
ncbi:MAG TPA: right-handed parallel beta-helix repeat-containing protein [Planctomycetota bacterium]|nr:right-handed parallel beta-helix repeat-containing protein [Planctomycetota bacterium]